MEREEKNTNGLAVNKPRERKPRQTREKTMPKGGERTEKPATRRPKKEFKNNTTWWIIRDWKKHNCFRI